MSIISGVVYCVSCPCIIDNNDNNNNNIIEYEKDKLYKIGNSNDLYTRMKSLQSTGVPNPFILHFALKTSNPMLLEKEIHNDLAQYRFAKNREFFKCSLKKIKASFDKTNRNYFTREEMKKNSINIANDFMDKKGEKYVFIISNTSYTTFAEYIQKEIIPNCNYNYIYDHVYIYPVEEVDMK